MLASFYQFLSITDDCLIGTTFFPLLFQSQIKDSGLPTVGLSVLKNPSERRQLWDTHAAGTLSCQCHSRCHQGNGWFCSSCLGWCLQDTNTTRMTCVMLRRGPTANRIKGVCMNDLLRQAEVRLDWFDAGSGVGGGVPDGWRMCGCWRQSHSCSIHSGLLLLNHWSKALPCSCLW